MPGVRVAPATVADTAAILAMVARCSPLTLFHRFHGYTDGLAPTQAALGRQPGETLAAWNGSACVGLATLGRDGQGIAHLGVLVEDAWQRRGVGRQLVAALLDGARKMGVASVHADVLDEDRFVLGALRRAGRSTVSIGRGTLSVDVDLGSATGANGATSSGSGP